MIFQKTKNLLKKILIKGINKFFPSIRRIYFNEFNDDIIKKILSSSLILGPIETLTEVEMAILKKKIGAYMRFGDGDVFLLNGQKDMLQESTQSLSIEMEEAFSIKGENIFKSLSLHSNQFGHEKEMMVGNHLVNDLFATRLINSTFPFFVGYKIYSPVALHFAATYHPRLANKFLKTLKKNCILFVGNEQISKESLKLLFGNVNHIKSPAVNSYDKINEIEEQVIGELERLKVFGVVVIAMGCSGRPLMKRILKKNYNVFLFDFGSLLDGISGEKTRTWLKINDIDYQTLLEGL